MEEKREYDNSAGGGGSHRDDDGDGDRDQQMSENDLARYLKQ